MGEVAAVEIRVLHRHGKGIREIARATCRSTVTDALTLLHPRGIDTVRLVRTVETPDPRTAVFRLLAPAPALLMAFGSAESPILPKHVYGTGCLRSHPKANEPVGSGPFKFVEWRKGQLVRPDRSPDD